jgi:radical SAM superfamily enzyme YgiQ (UPF0313 family)
MNIVILNPGIQRAFDRTLGPYQLAYYMRQAGHTVQVLDFLINFNAEDTKQIFDAYLPYADVIGLSSTFSFDTTLDPAAGSNSIEFVPFPYAIDLPQYLKDKCPNAKIVVGGANSRNKAYTKIADAIVVGYGEKAFLDYVNWLEGKNPFFMAAEIVDGLKVLKATEVIPKHFTHRFDKADHIFDNESLVIEVSRGCIFKCGFCSYPANGKNKLDYLRVFKDVADEMLYNYENYGTKNYFLSDDTLNDTTVKLQGLAHEISKLPFKPSCTAYIRLDLIAAYQEQLRLLDQIGVDYLFFGIESMHLPSRKSIGKGADSARLLNTLRVIKRLYPKWKTHGSFIVGLPHDTEEQIREGYEIIKKERLLTSVAYRTIGIRPNYETSWMSDLDVNWKSYGYHLDQYTDEDGNIRYDPNTWISNTGMTFQQGRQIVVDIEQDLKTWMHIRPSMIQPLKSLGIEFGESFDKYEHLLKDKNLVWAMVQEKLAQYKSKLLTENYFTQV